MVYLTLELVMTIHYYRLTDYGFEAINVQTKYYSSHLVRALLVRTRISNESVLFSSIIRFVATTTSYDFGVVAVVRNFEGSSTLLLSRMRSLLLRV